ncbi:hypothetical protein ACIQAC_28465 [Streptomyces sp. NPDC088387]|uniref:hypothetical protein n=1 Tax=Streptomyces sp. NPDC088387 TaxID=3365859 RepID=UPI0037F96200
MSDQQQAGDEPVTTQDNGMPKEPVPTPGPKPLDNGMPIAPTDTKDAIRTMDNGMPAPPALDLDRDGK